MLARGHGDKGRTLEARWIRGSIEQKKIFGSQVSAIGDQVRVVRFRYGCGAEPVPGAEHLNPGPDGRDP
jgi:hypothetical protein